LLADNIDKKELAILLKKYGLDNKRRKVTR